RSVDQSRRIDDYFARARSIMLLTGQNPVFRDFYAEPGTRTQRVHRGGRDLDRVNAALGYLETPYPDSIGEACFIDRTGPENARMVRGVRAKVTELSSDESGNPFFHPTFALPPGAVHQAKPHVSPDTSEWVVSNSTVMPSDDGVRNAAASAVSASTMMPGADGMR